MSARLSRLRVAGLVLAGLVCLPSHGLAQTEQVEYYALDALGSVRAVFDASGTLLSRLDYEPFGRELLPSAKGPDRKFAALFRDAEAGLDYAEARSYQVRTGRFSSPDPVNAGLTDPQHWNRYSYAADNPLMFVDPRGLFSNVPEDGLAFADEISVVAALSFIDYSPFGSAIPGTGPMGSWGWNYGGSSAQKPTQSPPAQTPTQTPTQAPGQTTPTPTQTPTAPPNVGFLNVIIHKAKQFLPTRVCGGGAFAYAGFGYTFGSVHAETLAIAQYDSQSGGSHGGLIGAGAGSWTGAYEATRDWRTGNVHHDGLVLRGVGTSATIEGGGIFQPHNNGLTVGGYFGYHGDTTRSVGGGGYITGCS